MNTCINKPVLLLVFNRPELTQLVINSIIKYKPKILYVACDGPRNKTDEIAINQIKLIINETSQYLTIKNRFLNVNLGCKMGVKSGIDWFFQNEEDGIILEDDCIPSDDFFYFASELLDLYSMVDNISHISGTNFSRGYLNTKNSYYFSKYFHVWGWATWKSKWNNYIEKEDKSEIYSLVEHSFKNLSERKNWLECFLRVYEQNFDTWDYQWVYTNLKLNCLSIMPTKNLVSNVGFNLDATHTTDTKNNLSSIPFEKMNFPLVHPKFSCYNPNYDFYSKIIFGRYNKIDYIKNYLNNFFGLK
jgi:hypothetical protein